MEGDAIFSIFFFPPFLFSNSFSTAHKIDLLIPHSSAMEILKRDRLRLDGLKGIKFLVMCSHFTHSPIYGDIAINIDTSEKDKKKTRESNTKFTIKWHQKKKKTSR